MSVAALNFPRDLYEGMVGHARETYPSECCGVLLAPASRPDALERLVTCRNIQDEVHAADPRTHPRTAKTAYFIDPKDLLRIERECRESGAIVRVIYHSHIDTGAYFSEEDVRRATYDGQPVFPDASYLVFSIVSGEARDQRLFQWNGNDGFSEVAIAIDGSNEAP